MLGPPLTFALSQDQTLQLNLQRQPKSPSLTTVENCLLGITIVGAFGTLTRRRGAPRTFSNLICYSAFRDRRLLRIPPSVLLRTGRQGGRSLFRFASGSTDFFRIFSADIFVRERPFRAAQSPKTTRSSTPPPTHTRAPIHPAALPDPLPTEDGDELPRDIEYGERKLPGLGC